MIQKKSNLKDRIKNLNENWTKFKGLNIFLSIFLFSLLKKINVRREEIVPSIMLR